MGNRADDEGTDAEIYRKPLTDTVHADTPTGAPEARIADVRSRRVTGPGTATPPPNPIGRTPATRTR